jgi:hypothetical protein
MWYAIVDFRAIFHENVSTPRQGWVDAPLVSLHLRQIFIVDLGL